MLLGSRSEKEFGTGGRKPCEGGRRGKVDVSGSRACKFKRPLTDLGPVTFGACCRYVVAISDWVSGELSRTGMRFCHRPHS